MISFFGTRAVVRRHRTLRARSNKTSEALVQRQGTHDVLTEFLTFDQLCGVHARGSVPVAAFSGRTPHNGDRHNGTFVVLNKRSNQSFRMRILPRRPRGRQDFANRHASDSSLKDGAVDAIAIMEQIAWGRVPREGLSHLVCRPFGSGMGGDVEMEQASPIMG